MRIIGGALRGRKLGTLQGRSIRPTSDRAKEALFNILRTQAANAAVLDLFAGTGALGIEALSRGATNAVFIDKAPASLSVLRKNVALCHLQEHSRVLQWDIVKNLECLRVYHRTFNLVFIDPPYGQGMIEPALQHLMASDALAKSACIVVEQDTRETQPSLPSLLKCEDQRRYGHTRLTFLSFAGDHIAS